MVLKTDTSLKLKINAFEADNLVSLRRKLMQIEAKFSQFYFNQVFQQFQRRLDLKAERLSKHVPVIECADVVKANELLEVRAIFMDFGSLRKSSNLSKSPIHSSLFVVQEK